MDYDTEPDASGRNVPDPGRRKLDAELCQASTRLEQLQAHDGLIVLESRKKPRPTRRGFKIASIELPARVYQ